METTTRKGPRKRYTDATLREWYQVWKMRGKLAALWWAIRNRRRLGPSLLAYQADMDKALDERDRA